MWWNSADDGCSLPYQSAYRRCAGSCNVKGVNKNAFITQTESDVIIYSHKHYSTDKCILKVMTSHKNYMNATGAAFTILKSEEQLGKVVFAEMAMTCLVTMVVLLGAVNGKSKSPLVPFTVGCTVIVNILAGWVWNVIKLNNRHF